MSIFTTHNFSPVVHLFNSSVYSTMALHPPCHVSLISSHTHLLFSVSPVLFVFLLFHRFFPLGSTMARDSDFLFHYPTEYGSCMERGSNGKAMLEDTVLSIYGCVVI